MARICCGVVVGENLHTNVSVSVRNLNFQICTGVAELGAFLFKDRMHAGGFFLFCFLFLFS